MLESAIEKFLIAGVKRRGGKCEKVRVIGARGFFDRFVVLPGGYVVLVELKRPKGRRQRAGRLSPHQCARVKEYSDLGMRVRVCQTHEQIVELLDEYDRRA